MGAALGKLLAQKKSRAVLVGLIAFIAARQYFVAKRRRHKKSRQLSTKGTTNVTMKKKSASPMTQIFWRLWPFKMGTASSSDPDAYLGAKELVAILLISILRTWHQDRIVYIKRDLLLATYQRNMSVFRKVMIESSVMAVICSVLYSIHRYLKERLSLLWREKLTKQLHREYFNKMSYYKLSHLNEQQISDVEERIVKDPRRFCKGLADEMEKFSAALTSGIWFTYKLYTMSSLIYSVSPLMYFFMAAQISLRIAPNFSRKWKEMLDLRSKYFTTQSRLKTHAEAISAYQGNAVERGIIHRAWIKFTDYCYTFVRDATIFDFAIKAFFVYGSHSVAEILILSQFVSRESQLSCVGSVDPSLLAKMSDHSDSTADRVKFNAILFSQIRYLAEYFIRAMSAQGVVVAVLKQLQQMQAPARRLCDLFDTLENFAQEDQTYYNKTFIDKDDTIAFENAQVYTPTGELLVKDLNFSIKTGHNLLLTGCNGSGKSSLFRCLGGLWQLRGGTITKPGGSNRGLNKKVFYLPQKPYNVVGTLRQQICYPSISADNLSAEELRALLTSVDLAYLLDRSFVSSSDTANISNAQCQKNTTSSTRSYEQEVDWENVLSMGEKQRLAMARLFYHKPEFAILDECTSGVSAAMEHRLYDACRERHITCITISHRPVLEQYHDLVINILKDGQGGWESRPADRSGASLQEEKLGGLQSAYKIGANQPAKANDAENPVVDSAVTVDAKMEQLRLEARSKKYKQMHAKKIKERIHSKAISESSNGKKTKTKGKDDHTSLFPRVTLLKRLCDVLWYGLLPRHLSTVREGEVNKTPWSAMIKDPEFMRIGVLAVVVISKTLMADALAIYDGYIVSNVLRSDWGLFIRAVGTGALFRTSLALADAALVRYKWYLNLGLRKRLTAYLMELYFRGNTFYDVSNQDDRIRDVEERITEQVETMCVNLTELWTSLLRPAFDILFNSIVIARVVGVRGLLSVWGYMSAAGFVMQYAVPNFQSNVRKTFAREGKFNIVHHRLVNHTESIAFFGGSEVEHAVCNRRFDQLRDHQSKTMLQGLRFNFFNNFVVRQTPDLMAFAMRMLYAMGFTDAQVLKGNSSALPGEKKKVLGTGSSRDLSSTGEYLQQTVTRTFTSFGDAFELQETVGNFLGTLVNVTDTMYVLQGIAAQQGMKKQGLERDDDKVRFESVDIVAPGGTCCVSGLTFTVEPKHPLIVTGPNGSGKSSLFRVLGGLWEIPSGGRVYRPCKDNEGETKVTKGDAQIQQQQLSKTVQTGSEHSDFGVFLVPQKPYHSNGSLADQITYPHQIPADKRSVELEQKLLDLLRLVEVENLVERWSWHDARIVNSVPVTSESKKINGVICKYLYAFESSFNRRGKLRRGETVHKIDITEDDINAEFSANDSTARPILRAVAKKSTGFFTPLTELQPGDRVKLLDVSKDAETGILRYSGWDRVQKWEDVLSLGEQQRIGCARLFYHSPKFAVLDECTSAVSIDVEKKLYEAAHARGVTSITISQRLALEEYHTHELQLGDSVSEEGWHLRKIAV